MNDPGTWTMERGLTVGWRGGVGGGGQKGKNWDNCKRINNTKIWGLDTGYIYSTAFHLSFVEKLQSPRFKLIAFC